MSDDWTCKKVLAKISHSKFFYKPDHVILTEKNVFE